jgi:hypothetical protein
MGLSSWHRRYYHFPWLKIINARLSKPPSKEISRLGLGANDNAGFPDPAVLGANPPLQP